MKTQQQDKTETRRQSTVDSSDDHNNGNAEADQKSVEKNARRSSVAKAFISFHKWCNNIK